MEATSPIDLKDLRRDWIGNVSGEEFYMLVSEQAAAFAANQAAMERGVLLAESDPIRFAAAFFAGLSLDLPLIFGQLSMGQWRVDGAFKFGQSGDNRRSCAR